MTQTNKIINRPRFVWGSWKRIVAVTMLLALVVSLVPLYTLAQYSYAGVDDYRYGLTTHAVWQETRSFAQTCMEAWRVAARTYRDWQGSFVSIFLMALQPGVFGNGLYGLSTAILLSVLVLSILCFAITACRRLAGMDAAEAIIVSSILAIACVQFVPTPVESYYWFNGGVYYTFSFSLALFAATLLIRRRTRRTAAQCVLLLLLALFIGFGNLITGLLTCLLLAVYIAYAWRRKERDALLCVMLGVLLLAFAANVFSPGNAVRLLENESRGQGAGAAILAACGDAVSYSAKWSCTPAGVLMLLPIPLYWLAAKRCSLRFCCPIAVSAASLLLLAAGFTPNEYALGMPGEARIIDIQYYLFVLLLAINAFWYTGWAQRKLQISARIEKTAAILIVLLSMLAACGIAIADRNMASASALLTQTSGKAQSYAAVWETRLSMLASDTSKDVTLPQCESCPPLLCMVELASDKSDPFYFYNEQVAAYFDKKTVLLEP